MPSVPKRPAARQFNSLSLRRTVAGEMARSLRTASPDVSREQARYRRLMQSAPSTEFGRDVDTLSPLFTSSLVVRDETSPARVHHRPSSQHWPRKLEPLPGRVVVPVAGRQIRSFPSEQVDQVLALEVPRQNIDSWSSPHHNLHNNSDTSDSSDRSCPELSTLVDKEIEKSLTSGKTKISTSPWCVTTATLAALAPLHDNVPQDSTPSTFSPLTVNAITSATTVVTAAVHNKPNAKLTPLENDVTNDI